MNPNDLAELSAAWVQAKEAEKIAQDERRSLEDKMLALINVAEDFEGTQNAEAGSYKIKLTGRLNYRIDADRLQDVAAEHGLSDYLSSLFRWRPEINAKSWKAAEAGITRPLLEAITTTPGRPSFAITHKP